MAAKGVKDISKFQPSSDMTKSYELDVYSRLYVHAIGDFVHKKDIEEWASSLFNELRNMNESIRNYSMQVNN